MSATQAWRLGRTFLAITMILWITNLSTTAMFITGVVALTLLLKAEMTQ